MAWIQGAEQEERKWRGAGEEDIFSLIARSCGQAAPISAARSCSRRGARWGERSCSPRRAPEQEKPLAGRGTSLHPSIRPQAPRRDFNNYIYTLPLSARAAIMSFITAAATSARGQLIADGLFAATAAYKAPASAGRIVTVILSSQSAKLWHQGPAESKEPHAGEEMASPAAERSTPNCMFASRP